MKKIMFNDKYGMNQAVLDGRKTETRRIVPERLFQECRSNGLIEAGGFNAQWKEKSLSLLLKSSPYKVGEEVAIAQNYSSIMRYYHSLGSFSERKISEHEQLFWNAMRDMESTGNDSAMRGDSNKMFVRADLMPHRIRITNVRVERLQDITDEDCLKEGIVEKTIRHCACLLGA